MNLFRFTGKIELNMRNKKIYSCGEILQRSRVHSRKFLAFSKSIIVLNCFFHIISLLDPICYHYNSYYGIWNDFM